MKKNFIILTAFLMATFTLGASAADYTIDNKGSHAFINFKIKHLGYSWLTGRFNTFSGTFSYDKDNINASKITVNIDPASIDSNHSQRDKHLRSDDFLDVESFKTAKFVSTKITDLGNGKLTIAGNFTLRNVTKPIIIEGEKIGEGKDPWGGYRAGFAGTTTLTLKDYGIPKDLGPASAQVQLELHIEGIRNK